MNVFAKIVVTHVKICFDSISGDLLFENIALRFRQLGHESRIRYDLCNNALHAVTIKTVAMCLIYNIYIP